jgi:hypothetical protein
MNSGTTKANAAWEQLCDLATELVPQYGARSAAFKAACAARRDLMAAAVDPFGRPLIRGRGGAQVAIKPEDSPIVKAAVRLGQAAQRV